MRLASLTKKFHTKTSTTNLSSLLSKCNAISLPNRFFHTNSFTLNDSNTTNNNNQSFTIDTTKEINCNELPIYVKIEESNIPPSVSDKIGRNLHKQLNHPLCIIKTIIQNHFLKNTNNSTIQLFDDFHPKVTTLQNFESLCFPTDHTSRQPQDTYYFNSYHLLRTHTTAHQVELLKKGFNNFLISGDVYRRDDIDATHYPVFHQMDGVKLFKKNDFKELLRNGEIIGKRNEDGVLVEVKRKNNNEGFEVLKEEEEEQLAFELYCLNELKQDLEGMAKSLFGSDIEMKWINEYFPFVEPGIELEILFRGKWLEVLGCGLIRKEIMQNANYDTTENVGYAFGVGLERLAMILFDIPDIRLFWSQDNRFLKQFNQNIVNDINLLLNTKFKPYSKYPGCYKDISFWIDGKKWSDNDFYEIVRELAGDLVENVSIVDDFVHPKTGKRSKCYRIMYRSMDRSLTNEEIDNIQFKLRELIPNKLSVTLR
ncbi:hypothetical protein ABK040_005137 [Willaertia magna]